MKKLRSLFALCAFFLCLSTAATSGQSRQRVDGVVDVTRWITTQFGRGKTPPFSFVYGDRPSGEFIRKWRHTGERLTGEDASVIRYRYTYTDPVTGLRVVCDVKGFPEFQTVEWVMNFTNTGSANTPKIRDVKVVDHTMDYLQKKGAFRLLRTEGVHCFGSRADFRPHYEVLEAGRTREIYPDTLQGRSSDEDAAPFFNLVTPSERQGVVSAIGWSGTWQADFRPDGDGGVSMTAGMRRMDLTLWPGETIRTPSVCLLFWQGEDLMVGQNAFRRFVLAHHSQKIDGKTPELPLSTGFNYMDPPPCTESCCLTADYAMSMLRRYQFFDLVPEVFWLDAGWFKGCGYYEGGYAWGNLGHWVPDPLRFPDGIKPLADAAHGAGAKFLLWFEPERVMPNTKFADEHPEFMSHRPDRNYFLYDFGNPKAVEWLCEYYGDFIEENGIDIYRQDCCIYPAYWWRANDTPDRIGISEIRHIEGLYRFWDYLQARFPDMLMDLTAGGACRLDLESMSRGASLFRSDYEFGEPDGMQCHTYGFHLFSPLNGSGVFRVDPYARHSGLGATAIMHAKITEPRNPIPDMKRFMDDFKTYRPYFYEDYYPLTGFGDLTGVDVWLAYQFHRPSDGTGIALAFRRQDNTEPTLNVRLRGLDPEARYEVLFEDAAAPTIHRGADLATGITLRIDETPGSLLMTYRPAE